MKRCEQCAYYMPDEVEENVGVCEYTELMVDADDFHCNRFTEKEND